MPGHDQVQRAVLKSLVDTEQRSVIANLSCWVVTAIAAIFLPTAIYFLFPLIFRLVAMVGTRTTFARLRSALDEDRSFAREYRLLAVALVVGGAAWGSTLLPILAYPTLHPARLLVAGGTLVGMSIIVTMLSPAPRLATFFALGFLGAFGAGLVITDTPDGLILMLGMTILFLIFIAYSHASTFSQTRSAQLLVENRRLSDDLRASLERALHMADHDSLTGMFNRRAFFAHTKQALWAKRLVIMIDIDHFKTINDRYGHAVGDVVLKRIGRVIRTVLEEEVGTEHYAARLGGEEFAVMVPCGPTFENRALTDTLHRRIAGIAEQMEIEGLVTTASLGVAVMDRQQTLDEALHNADTALYRAKAQGRNRTEYALMSAKMAAIQSA
ncbi:GGDEF domain-containing protein [Qipengyuania sp. SS22]|uniref:GGDEF domain-containing protein n=1 Tax=Qipengyuania sp. SS22 TaxID=2979461 RepID=UPI0021E61711|nr:GGDEF domain-containing protein [Qipengyuania sp. SS22]UYH53814.1 GGDEF domain-containing protein [Qipengyuania sp. SS22]